MSDVSAGILPVIAVDRKSGHALHRQIYDGFRAAILRGDLRPGQQVPSSRALAAELLISRFPILDAYAQLLAEGYFESRVGAGTFVSASLPEQRPQARSASRIPSRDPSREPNRDPSRVPAIKSAESGSGARPMSRRSELLPMVQFRPWSAGLGSFAVHLPALEHFPFPHWSNLVARHSRSPKMQAIHHVDPMGQECFREAICDYLRTARGVRCDASQIMVVSGSQQALDITARVLLDPGDRVWIEEPAYQLTRWVLLGAGCRLVPVPVDGEGMDVAAGMRMARKARAAFVAPSHQYPLGTTMSASRRLQLLNWAHDSGAWIIEDDYDSEYRYGSMRIASLQGLDMNSRVIYIGTFSKVLFPSLRLGYIVIPQDLVDRFKSIRFAMDIFPPYLYQEVLTEFMREGHFARHVRKMRLLYQERRAALVENLKSQCDGLLDVHGSEAGMHLAVTLVHQQCDVETAKRAAKEKLWLWPLSPSYLGEPRRQGFILGFGSTSVEQMPQAVGRLRSVLTQMKS
jgi:GntR family transcriptional regulator/MocR family aminotransferase